LDILRGGTRAAVFAVLISVNTIAKTLVLFGIMPSQPVFSRVAVLVFTGINVGVATIWTFAPLPSLDRRLSFRECPPGSAVCTVDAVQGAIESLPYVVTVCVFLAALFAAAHFSPRRMLHMLLRLHGGDQCVSGLALLVLYMLDMSALGVWFY